MQYAAASRFNHNCLWNTGSPGQAGRRQPGAFSRHVLCPSCSISLSLSSERAQGKPGACRTRSLGAKEKAPEQQSPRVQPVTPAFPAQWFDGLLRALPGERRLLSPLPSQHRPERIDATVAAPGPHDFAVRCSDFVRQQNCLTPQRPSQPAPRSVTIARTSLMVTRAGRTSARDLPDEARDIF